MFRVSRILLIVSTIGLLIGCRSQLRWVEIENGTPWSIKVDIDSDSFDDVFEPGQTARLSKEVYRGGAMRVIARKVSDGKVVYKKDLMPDDLKAIDDGEVLKLKIEQ